MSADNKATLSELRDFFGMGTREFTDEWRRLSDSDKEELKTLLGKLLGK